MGAPKGNKNASGSRKPKTTRYQNTSTIVTSVDFADGRHRTMKPGMKVEMTEEDVQATIDGYADEDQSPWALGLLQEIPHGNSVHPAAPVKHKRISVERAKSLITEGTQEEVEEAIAKLPDTGGMLAFQRALIDLGSTLNKKRSNLVSDLINERGEQIATQNKKLRRQHANIGA